MLVEIWEGERGLKLESYQVHSSDSSRKGK